MGADVGATADAAAGESVVALVALAVVGMAVAVALAGIGTAVAVVVADIGTAVAVALADIGTAVAGVAVADVCLSSLALSTIARSRHPSTPPITTPMPTAAAAAPMSRPLRRLGGGRGAWSFSAHDGGVDVSSFGASKTNPRLARDVKASRRRLGGGAVAIRGVCEGALTGICVDAVVDSPIVTGRARGTTMLVAGGGLIA